MHCALDGLIDRIWPDCGRPDLYPSGAIDVCLERLVAAKASDEHLACLSLFIGFEGELERVEPAEFQEPQLHDVPQVEGVARTLQRLILIEGDVEAVGDDMLHLAGDPFTILGGRVEEPALLPCRKQMVRGCYARGQGRMRRRQCHVAADWTAVGAESPGLCSALRLPKIAWPTILCECAVLSHRVFLNAELWASQVS